MSEYTDGVAQYVARGEEMVAAAARLRAVMKKKKFDTIAVHGMYDMEAAMANQGSIIEPGYLASAEHFENSDHMEAALAYLMPGWVYSRIANPTVHYLEETLALLEGYDFPGNVSAVATASGMSAVFMATNPFLEQPKPGMNIVASARCYGGTFMLFNQRYGGERGVEIRWVRDPLDLGEWEARIDSGTRFVYSETPSNPLVSVMDIAAVADVAHAAGLPLIVDSTIATPALTRPLNLGADIVIHSTTKSMTASGFAIGGVVVARHGIKTDIGPVEMREDFARYVKLLPFRDHGPGVSPFNALMTINDLRTLRHRMDVQSASSMLVAEFLESHDRVDRVAYPGLASMPGHDVAAKTMRLVDSADEYGSEVNRYGHLVAFEVNGGATAARKVFDGFEMIWRATDLGRIKGRNLASVPENLIRLNVGAEHPDDVIADLDQALSRL